MNRLRDDIVKALGGPAQTARRFNVSTQALWVWRRHGLPPERWLPVWAACTEAGIAWTPPGFDGFRLVPMDGGRGPQ